MSNRPCFRGRGLGLTEKQHRTAKKREHINMLKEHQELVNALFVQCLGQTDLNLKWDTPAEADELIRNIDLLVQELRYLKRKLRSDRQEKSSHIVVGLDGAVGNIDAVIMQLALAKVQIGKGRYERGSLEGSYARS